MADLRQLFFCASLTLCLSAFAGTPPGGTPAKKPSPQPATSTRTTTQPSKPVAQAQKTPASQTKPIPQPTPAPVEKPEVSDNELCFCADNETNLQGCAVGAVKITEDLSGQLVPVCLDPQVIVRPEGNDAPEGCELQDIHTGEVRPGHVQCVVTGSVVCK